MNELQTAIAKGRFAMIGYLEGRFIYVDNRWQEVVNCRVQGHYGIINLFNHEIGVLEDFCRKSKSKEEVNVKAI